MLALASTLVLAAAPPVITSGPDKESTRSSATFHFTAPVSGRLDTYVCDLGPRTIRKLCTSPVTFTDLEPGTYTFNVRSRLTPEDADSWTWTITAIDDDGDGHALPADCDDGNPRVHPGAADVPGNGVDEDCSGADAPIVIYEPAPTPPAPAAPPAPVPTPTPAPVAKPKLSFTLSYFMRASKRSTRFSALSVKGVPKGATVKVRCTGGCPRRSQTFKRSGTVALTGFRNRPLRAGAKLTITVSRKGAVGMRKVVQIRANKRPRITTRALAR